MSELLLIGAPSSPDQSHDNIDLQSIRIAAAKKAAPHGAARRFTTQIFVTRCRQPV